MKQLFIHQGEPLPEEYKDYTVDNLEPGPHIMTLTKTIPGETKTITPLLKSRFKVFLKFVSSDPITYTSGANTEIVDQVLLKVIPTKPPKPIGAIECTFYDAGSIIQPFVTQAGIPAGSHTMIGWDTYFAPPKSFYEWYMHEFMNWAETKAMPKLNEEGPAYLYAKVGNQIMQGQNDCDNKSAWLSGVARQFWPGIAIVEVYGYPSWVNYQNHAFNLCLDKDGIVWTLDGTLGTTGSFRKASEEKLGINGINIA